MTDSIETSPVETRSRWRRAKPFLTVVTAGIVLLVLWRAWDREAMMRWKEEASPLAFFAVMAILPALGVPTTPLFILAGATFGRRLGLLGSALALAANLAVVYRIARSSLQPRLASLLQRFDYALPNFAEARKGAFRFALTLKLAPGVPAFVKNYGLGVARVPFALYFGLSMLISGIYGGALVVFGESIFAHRIDRAVVLAAIVVAGAAGLAWWSKRRRE